MSRVQVSPGPPKKYHPQEGGISLENRDSTLDTRGVERVRTATAAVRKETSQMSYAHLPDFRGRASVTKSLTFIKVGLLL